MELAVLGGSFDPVHNGHVAMAQYVLENDLASKVLVIPAFRSPFKPESAASSLDRMKMANLAFAHCGQVRVDDLEIRRGGSSYMVETLEELHRLNPQSCLRLIFGADNVDDFFQWEKPEKILSLAKILVLGRHGHSMKIPPRHRDSFLLYPDFDQRMSSTEIRVMLAAGDPVGDFLPPAVANYIQANGLYL